MAKFFTALYLFLLVCGVCYSQSYSVIHIKGNIINEDTGEKLFRGIKLDQNSRLQFENEDAVAAVLSSDRGRYILSTRSLDNVSKDLLYVLSSVIMPARGKMSSRSGSINNLLDFQNTFKDPIAWINDTLSIKVSETAYPVGEDKFFFVRYNYQGEMINKLLNYSSGNLHFVKEDFYSVDGKPVAPASTSDHQLYYYDRVKESSSLISPIGLNPVSEDKIVIIYNELAPSEKDERIEIVHEMISSMYGQCNPEDIEKIVDNAL